MPDSTGGGQDDAGRINGLMASMGRRTLERDAALAERDTLATQLAELRAALDGKAQESDNDDSQPASGGAHSDGDGGLNVLGGDQTDYGKGWVREAPSPRGNNGRRDLSNEPNLDAMSSDQLRTQLDGIVGKPSSAYEAWPV
jgi:hypothetical protein